MVHLMTILRAFLGAPSCIIAATFSKKSASSSRSLSTGNGPWGFFLKGKTILDPLLGGVFNGEVDGASVEVVVLLFYACFELGAFALIVERSSQTTLTCNNSIQAPKPEPIFTNKRFEMRGEGWI